MDAHIRRQQAYVFDLLNSSRDPLIDVKRIAATPIHTLYKIGRPIPVTGFLNYTGSYTSHYHVELAIFLHRLGLRGRPRYHL